MIKDPHAAVFLFFYILRIHFHHILCRKFGLAAIVIDRDTASAHERHILSVLVKFITRSAVIDRFHLLLLATDPSRHKSADAAHVAGITDRSRTEHKDQSTRKR